MQAAELKPVFEKIRKLRVGVIGDFAVDFYFDVQKRTGEHSLETSLEVWWGTQSRTSLGGAGNVVQNLAALGVGEIEVFGAIGNDIFGRELLFLLQEKKVDTSGIIRLEEGWETCTYTKPMQEGQEQNRLDFGVQNRLQTDDFVKIIDKLKARMSDLDVLIINQQFDNPLLTEARVLSLNELIGQYPEVYVLADMRTYGLGLRGVTLKVNTAELARLLGMRGPENWTDDDCILHGKKLTKIMEGPILITRAEHGMLHVEGETTHHYSAFSLPGPIDPVGAGDTAVAAFSACTGAKVAIPVALELANLAAAVTVQKLHQTGTASPEEIAHLLANA